MKWAIAQSEQWSRHCLDELSSLRSGSFYIWRRKRNRTSGVLGADHGYNRPATYKHAEALKKQLKLNVKAFVPKVTAGALRRHLWRRTRADAGE